MLKQYARRFAWLAVVLAAVAAACAPAYSTTTDSGIEGQVVIGPMCPVVASDEPCPNQPYQATITVMDQNGTRVTQFQTDAEGRFRVSLKPGTYVLRPEPPASSAEASDEGLTLSDGITRAAEQTVSVAGGQFTQVDIIYDSGIR